MNLEELRIKYLNDGFSMANASSKICQDIILFKIANSIYSKNVTIKGGVVMYGLSNDKRRATRDLDLDFIKYSLDDNSIINFINQLNNVNDGIKIDILGTIELLQHQDYKGKRVNIQLKDRNNFYITSKLDIGVHKNFDIKQETYCFSFDAINESATLIVNSKEQIITEKLKSLLKFGIRSTRYKDIFDFYFLINNTNLSKDKLIDIIDKLIIKDDMMKENNLNDVSNKLKQILTNKLFLNRLSDAKNNWLDLPIEDVVNNVLEYFENIVLTSV